MTAPLGRSWPRSRRARRWLRERASSTLITLKRGGDSCCPAKRGRTTRPGPRAAERGTVVPDHLPELLALGIGSLTCAALARRSRRRFRPEPMVHPLDAAPFSAKGAVDTGLQSERAVDTGPLSERAVDTGPLSERAVDTATLVRRFSGVPALGGFEAANCLLADALRHRESPEVPPVRLVQVGPQGVTFHLSRPQSVAPPGFDPRDGGLAWHIDHEALDSWTGVSYPLFPVTFPVGDDEDGTWLLALGPGSVLPVLGETAPALLRGARAALESWVWSDLVVVTDDADDPRLSDRLVDPETSPHCVYFGPLDALTAPVAARPWSSRPIPLRPAI